MRFKIKTKRKSDKIMGSNESVAASFSTQKPKEGGGRRLGKSRKKLNT